MDIRTQLESIKQQVKIIENKIDQYAPLKDIKTREHYKKIIESLNAWNKKIMNEAYPRSLYMDYAQQFPIRELLDAYELMKLIDEKSIQFPNEYFIAAIYLVWHDKAERVRVKLADGVLEWAPEKVG